MDIHCNADTAWGPEHILRILMYITNLWNADTPLFRNADSKYGPNDTVTIVINLSMRTELSFLSSTRDKKFSVKMKCKYGWAWKKHRKEEGMKTQEDYPAAEKSW